MSQRNRGTPSDTFARAEVCSRIPTLPHIPRRFTR